MLLCFNPYDHENFNTFQLVYFTMKCGSSIVTKRFASGNLAMKKKRCLTHLLSAVSRAASKANTKFQLLRPSKWLPVSLFFSLNKGFYFIIGVSCVCWRDQAKQNRVADRTNIDFPNSSWTGLHREEERKQSANTPAFIDAGSNKVTYDWPAVTNINQFL